METVYVKPDGQLYCPKRIPRERKYWSNNCLPILIGIFIMGALLCINDISQIGLMVSVMIISLCMVEFMIRVVMFFEEMSYIDSRYDGKISDIFIDVFSCNYVVYIAFAVSLFGWVLLRGSITSEMYCCISLFMAIYVVMPFMKLKKSPLYDGIEISTTQGLDFGSAMAISFFYGYLRVVLPANPQNNRGIKAFMRIYESREHIRFINQALYILIPLSMYIPPRVSDLSPIMEEASSLDPFEEDRAGVRNRNYKNSIYKIKHEGGFIYVAVEFASPLKTFLEACNNGQSSTLTDNYKKHTKDILWKFYTTLKTLVNADPDLRGLCEFVYYDDVDENGDLIDIGKVLLKQLVREKISNKRKISL